MTLYNLLHKSLTLTQTQITQTLVRRVRVRVRVKRDTTQQGWACPEWPSPTQTCWNHMHRELFPACTTHQLIMGAPTITPHRSADPCETWLSTHATCIEYWSQAAQTPWSAIQTLIVILHDSLTNRRNANCTLEPHTWPPPHQSLHSLYWGLMRRPNVPPLEIFMPIWCTHYTSPRATFSCFKLTLYSWQCTINYPYSILYNWEVRSMNSSLCVDTPKTLQT